MSNRKPINLALQGGGSHGAFTWGVLDALLEDGRADITGISGTSAGAMNAVLLASGYVKGGADEARLVLHNFWSRIGGEGDIFTAQADIWKSFFGALGAASPFSFFNSFSNTLSPYDANPFDLNPVRDALNANIDFDAVRASPIQLFISATNVHTGKIKIFRNNEMSADSVMASACLPYLFKAVEIDGVPYWDGGYLGNPALFPFFTGTDCEDILLVQINPIERNATPRSAQDITERLNEITFNSSLLAEYRAIDFVRWLLEQGKLTQDEYKNVRMHRIDADKTLVQYGAASKMDVSWSFLSKLRDEGRLAALYWMNANWDSVGERATLDIAKEIAKEPGPQEPKSALQHGH